MTARPLASAYPLPLPPCNVPIGLSPPLPRPRPTPRKAASGACRPAPLPPTAGGPTRPATPGAAPTPRGTAAASRATTSRCAPAARPRRCAPSCPRRAVAPGAPLQAAAMRANSFPGLLLVSACRLPFHPSISCPMKNSLCCLIALCLLAGACKKNDPDADLPPATQEGKNTAGVLLDGKPWLPKGSPTSPHPYGVSWPRFRVQGGRTLEINFFRYNSKDDLTAVNFHFPDVRHSGTFDLSQYVNTGVISGPRPPYAVYSIYEPGPDRKFYTGSTARGQIIITRFDTVARVVAGSFEAKLREEGGPDSLNITQGRFDLTF